MTLFVRLLEESDKGGALERVIERVGVSAGGPQAFEVAPTSFEQVPGAPFAYWVSERVRQLFGSMTPLATGARSARVTNPAGDDRRWIRASWETMPTGYGGRGNFTWVPLAKGGEFSPYYYDVHLVVQWNGKRNTYHGFLGTEHRPLEKPASLDYFFRPGLTWPRRTQSGLALRALPAGCIFADKGPAAFVDGDDSTELLSLLAVTNSLAFKSLVELQMAFGSYEVGVIQRTPVPELSSSDRDAFAALARRAWSTKWEIDTAELTSHAFVLPALLQCSDADLAARAENWNAQVSDAAAAIAEVQSEIDDFCFDFYGFSPEDRRTAGRAAPIESSVCEPGVAPDDAAEEEALPVGIVGAPRLAAALTDWLVGVAFGRFDLRLATGEHVPPPAPEPFDPLPVCSPGMLTRDNGFPQERVPAGYQIDFPSDGILVDDPGPSGTVPARRDLALRMRTVIDILWGDKAESVEAELCGMLGARTLRDWLRRTGGFFADHLVRHTKSRRRAPIYWPLSTESGSYTLWLYYPRLTDQTLYACVTEHLDPKLNEIEADARRLRGAEMADRGIQTRLAELEELRRELEAMRDELLRVAALPYRPDQNDGVLITAATLWKLFRHRPWQRELEKCWKALESGEYDWAHLALAVWPERVRETCRNDKSIAIAHELEDLYEGD